MSGEARGFRIERYDRAKHGEAPHRIVASTFADYGFEFDAEGWDSDVVYPEQHFAGAGQGLGVACSDNAVLGITAYGHLGGPSYELKRLYVDSRERRAGAGGALVRWVLDEVGQAGGEHVILFSDIAFLDAHRLYERMGFRRTRFRYGPDPWQSREWGFELDLREDAG